MKPKICLVCDVPNWAFDIIAQKIKKDLNYKYDIRIDYYDMRKDPDGFYEFLEKHDDCDLVHFFWRKSLIQFESDALKSKVLANGISLENYIRKKSLKVSTGVYDFLFLDDAGINTYKNIFNVYASNYYVSSKKLYAEYMKIDSFKKPKAIVHDICDGTRFIPINLDRFKDEEKSLTIRLGW